MILTSRASANSFMGDLLTEVLEVNNAIRTFNQTFDMRYLLFILLAAFLTNCTIQKRVHRKGWHVEWKRNYKSQKSDPKQDEERFAWQQAETKSQESVEKKTVSAPNLELEEINHQVVDQRAVDQRKSKTSQSSDKQYIDNIGDTQSEVKVETSEEKEESYQAKEKQRLQSRSGGGGKGTTILIVGAVLLLLGLLSLFLIVFAADLGAAILGAVLFALLGGIGLILMLIGLIIIIAS